MLKTDYDAVVIGSGPNGLAAAIAIRQQGLSVLVIEAASTTGGGTRTKELTLPGYLHDVCSAVHPLAAGSPFFTTLPLSEYGLEYLYPSINAAHPLDNGRSALFYTDIEKTASTLGSDKQRYIDLISPLLAQWPQLSKTLLGPIHFPKNPFALAEFGLKGIRSAVSFADMFNTTEARALFAGMAAHAIQPLTNYGTAAFGLVLMLSGHAKGWPVAKGGSQAISDALVDYFKSIGGEVVTGIPVKSLAQLPSYKALLFDTAPDQLITIAGHKLSSVYKWQLGRYKYGPGTFKIDWALDLPIPFSDIRCRDAATIHLGDTLENIRDGELRVWQGGYSESPYVLLSQQSVIDATRAPAGKHTAWAYCHVPNGSTKDMTTVIERQVEKVAPGFSKTILARHTINSEQLQQYNANYVGGDINSGAISLSQLFTRPALRFSPYRTSAKGLYICSAATPPGGGVHGMCGYHAARRALKDIFKIEIKVF